MKTTNTLSLLLFIALASSCSVDNQTIENITTGEGASSANLSPNAIADSDTLDQGATKTLSLSANDYDLDGSLNLSSIVISSAPSYGSIVINGDGSVDYTHDGSSNLSDSFSYTISDNLGSSSSAASVSLTMNATPTDAEIKVTWDHVKLAQGDTSFYNPYTYKIEYGTSSGVYTNTVSMSDTDCKFCNFHTIENLPDATTYYGVVKVVDSEGRESLASSEWSLTSYVPSTPTSSSCDINFSASDLPLTTSANNTYCLTENVTYNSGTAITLSGDNVKLDLQGYTITYAETGVGHAIKLNSDWGQMGQNIEIYNGKLLKGSYDPSSESSPDICAIRLKGHLNHGLKIYDMDFEIGVTGTKSGTKAGAIWVTDHNRTDITGMEVYNNNFIFTSGNGHTGIRIAAPSSVAPELSIYNNTFTMHDLGKFFSRPTAIHATSNAFIYKNTIDINEDCNECAGIAMWAVNNAIVSDNNFTVNAQIGRAIVVDGDSHHNYVVHDQMYLNRNPALPSVGSIVGIRLRYGSYENSIGANIIDGIGEDLNYGIFLGGKSTSGGGTSAPSDNYIYRNNVNTANYALFFQDGIEDTFIWDNVFAGAVFSINMSAKQLGSGDENINTTFEGNTYTGDIYMRTTNNPGTNVTISSGLVSCDENHTSGGYSTSTYVLDDPSTIFATSPSCWSYSGNIPKAPVL